MIEAPPLNSVVTLKCRVVQGPNPAGLMVLHVIDDKGEQQLSRSGDDTRGVPIYVRPEWCKTEGAKP